MSNLRKTPSEMPKEERFDNTFQWREHTLYLVHVGYSLGNPIHEAYVNIGFTSADGFPAGYSHIISTNGDVKDFNISWRIGDLNRRYFGNEYVIHYLQVIKVLHSRTKT